MKNSRKAQKQMITGTWSLTVHKVKELTIPKEFVLKQIIFIIKLNNPSFKHYNIHTSKFKKNC